MRVKNLLPANLAKAYLCAIIATSVLHTAEPSSWYVGVGGGYGLTQISKTYSSSSKTGGLNVTWIEWWNQRDSHYKSSDFAFEALIGYKHFLNDYLGLRYYANIGAQLYRDNTFSSGKVAIGVVDYTANADLLLNFYTNPRLSVGIFGGFGVGGAYFDSPEIKRYERYWGGAKDSTLYTQSEFNGVGEVFRNHFSASINTGARINFFQQLRGVGQVVCKPSGDGRRTCHQPIMSLEHSLEVSAKFFMIPYRLTKAPEVMGHFCSGGQPANQGKYRCAAYRYGYEVSAPYRFTLRYILAF